MKKIIALFPSTILYGKERSNLEVFRILKNSEHFSLSIIANREASIDLKEMLQDFDTTYLFFPTRKGKLRFLRYFYRYFIVNIYLAFYIMRNKVDCIYLNDEMSVFDFFPILFFTKAKIIYRIGDAPAFPTLTGYKLNSFMWNKIVNNKVSTIVAISNFIKSEIEKYGRDSKNDCVIYNYPPTRKLQNNDKLYFRHDSSLKIGYLGRIDNDKGCHILIDAVINMLNNDKDVSLYIAGSISVSPEYYKEIHNNVKYSGYENRIKFINEINNVVSFFENIDVLCVPTLVQEALGNVILEAKQNRTPVVVFPSGGMPEIIEHGVDGFICTDKTSKSIVEIMNLYCEDKNLIELQSTNSYLSLEKLGIKYEVFQNKWNNVFIETLK